MKDVEIDHRSAADPSQGAHHETEQLLQDLNETSAAARNSWIFLIALETYFFIALSSIGHIDLLLNSPVAQPILQVSIPLRTFILFGPIFFICIHVGILLQNTVLARKLNAFDQAIGTIEQVPLDHPKRLRVHGYYLAQLRAGAETNRFVRATFRLIDLLSLYVLPVVLLVMFQVVYLPVHDALITGWHRAYIAFDLLVLVGFALILRTVFASKTPARRSLLRAIPAGLLISAFLGLVLVFSLCVATIPGERIDRFLAARPSLSAPVPYEGLGNVSRDRPAGARGRRAFWPTAILFEGEVDDWTRTTASVFSRNLVVIDADLVPDDRWVPSEVSLSLRGRDMNFATFDRSDLRGVDLTDASLKGASFVGTNLEKARLVRVRMQGADLSDARLKGAKAEAVLLEGARICNDEMALPMDWSTGIERTPCPLRKDP